MGSEFTLARRTAFFALGATMYALVGILPQLSRSGSAHMEYDNTVVVALAEVGKFVLSLGFLTNWDVRSSAIRDNFAGFKEVLVYFSVPAFLYAVANNLDMLLALHMDAATFQVMMQSKIVFTSVLWWMVFRKSLSLAQWTAIGILAIGSALTSLQKTDGGSKGMGIHSLAGVPLIVLALASSTVAAVSTEWIYKRIILNDCIHVHNLAMYSWGILINGVAYISQRKSEHPFQGFNIYTWLNVLNFVFLGLAMSVVMKHFSNITKLFIFGASMYLSTLAAVFLFHLTPSAVFIVGLSLVTVSLGLYNWEYMFPVSDYSAVTGMDEKRVVIGKSNENTCTSLRSGGKSASDDE